MNDYPNADYKRYMDSLPETHRRAIQQHRVSFCALSGLLIPHPEERENQFEVVARMERYIVDTNSNWKAEAAKPGNRERAFIVGKTVTDEQEDLKGLLFGPKVNMRNDNIFVLGVNSLVEGAEPIIFLERLDQHYRGVFDEERLSADSKPREEKERLRDTRFLEYQGESVKGVESERKAILWLLGQLNDVSELPPPKALEKHRAAFRAFIQDEAPRCAGEFLKGALVARYSYALLLMEKLNIRTEFADEAYLNVLGMPG
jgi:hypothetical protein